ncbi:glycosyltransferase family 2 protein [Lacinutrix sp. MEBiC02595]
MNPLISIIIPTFNRAHIIGETLDSIIAQTYTNWECIVVDDCSSDNTAEVMGCFVEMDHRFQYYTRPIDRQKGPCSCRNYGFEKSKGHYINFFDSDDLLKSNAFELWLAGFSNEIDVVIGKTQKINLTTGALIELNQIFSQKLIEDYFTLKISFHVCGPLWNRRFLEEQEYLFDEQIGNIDDWDFNLRMLYASPKLVLLNDVLIYYRIHPNSFSKEVIKLNPVEIASDFAARDKHLILIKNINDIDLNRIQQFILYRYKRYIKWAISQKENDSVFLLLFKELVKKQLLFRDYWGAFKSCIGYIVFRLTGKGYVFFKG